MHRYRLLTALLGGLLWASVSFAQWDEYRFYDTYNYANGSFESDFTVFSDINDKGVIVGWFKNQQGTRTGLVYYKNGEADTFRFDGYNNTEILGINDAGEMVGRAYNTPSTAVAFKAILDGRKIKDAETTEWYGTGGSNRWPVKINNDGIASGSVQNGSSRFLNYQKVFGISTVKKATRYFKGTQYNTYGGGLNEKLEVAGYYIDGSKRIPFVYSNDDDKFYLVDHRVDYGNSSTLLNDINNSGLVALEYRDSQGYWQGTLGQYDNVSHSITYYDSFAFNQHLGISKILGVNNNGDFVGYYSDKYSNSRAFYATKSGYEIEGFDLKKHGLAQVNGASHWQYDTFDYDYVKGDPYFRDTMSFLNAVTQHVTLDTHVKESLILGRRSPSWPSYVLAKGASRCYVGGQLRVIEALKWISLTSDSFQGFCNGISIMTAQHFSDTAKIYGRFPLLKRSGNLADYQYNNTKFDLRFKESVGALQMYQMSRHFREVGEVWNRQVWRSKHGKYDELWDLVKEQVSELAHDFYDSSATDSLNLFFIYFSYNPNSPRGGHAIFPYKVTRLLHPENPVDTVYFMEPNYPQEPIKIAFNYGKYVGWAYDSSDNFLYNVWAASLGGNLAQINMTQRAQLSPQDRKRQRDEHMKASRESATIFTAGLCDYTIENLDQSGQKIEVKGDDATNTYDGMSEDLIFDSDHLPDAYNSEKEINAKATLTGCNNSHWLHYAHENGDMLYSRNGVKPSDQDVVYLNGATMRVVNEGADARDVRLTSIYEDEDEEALVTVNGFELSSGKELVMDAMGMYKVKVDNNQGDDNDYDLSVRYISGGKSFNWETDNIDIDKDDVHTILLKPEDADKEVIILVDTTGDGNTDDTLRIENNSSVYEFIASQHNIKIYPNPASTQLNVELSKLTSSNTNLQLYDVTGKAVLNLQFTHGSTLRETIDVSSMTPGIYMLELQIGEVGVYRKRIVIR